MKGISWLSLAAGVIGLVWLLTSFSRGDLGRRGADPRAIGPAIWTQRGLGLLLLLLGLLGLLRR